jgi:hypothetical protein
MEEEALCDHLCYQYMQTKVLLMSASGAFEV